MNTASCRSAITYLDGEKGILEYRGYPIEQLAEQSTYLEVAYLLIHGELPDASSSSTTGRTRSRSTRSSTRTSSGSWRASTTTPTRWGCSLGSVGALSTFYPEAKEINDDERALQADRPPDRQDADAGRLRLPPQRRHAVRLSGQRPHLPGQLPLDDVEDRRAQVRARSRASSARSTCCSSSTPTTSRTARTTAVRVVGSLARRPVLGRRRRHRRALRPAARRRQRGRCCGCSPRSARRERPRLHRRA